MTVRLSVVLGWIVLASAGLAAQEKEPAADSNKTATAAQEKDSAADFDTLFAQWKQLLSRLRTIQSEYPIAKPADRAALEKEFHEKLALGDKLAPQLRKAAETAYVADPNAKKELADFLAAVAFGDNKSDNYEEAARLAQLLLDHKCSTKGLDDLLGTAAFEIADFDAAEKYLKAAEENKTLSDKGKGYQGQIEQYRKYWEKEQEIRAAEAKADDLPRVLLKTSKGDMVIELFENEAPNTVASFVSLVDAKFYDGLAFHRVLEGFMAQGGDPKGDGTGGPGYTIACECHQENHRIHFRGSLSMAHAGRDTGGSQFFLTFRPTSHLNGQHTVFGRVIEGIDVLSKLQRRDPGASNPPIPDKIIEAKVLRKRDHEYKPVKGPAK